ncbi:asparagine synthase-related protein [Cereibacter azotoformans]|uniref:asparagine synthase-related protein n=1 Tax=Cereibacter azotoformans TaxID=43057 RepID=UPI000C6CA223|nr:asparagine synthase-related protein [Cereibacter azotoformans]
MSALAAFVTLGGDPSEAEGRVKAMLAAMPSRGPEARSVLLPGGVALGHRARHAAMGPWRLRPGGPVLTGSLRLDNAAELQSALGLAEAADAALVLAAYDRWGLDLPLHLEGDFALVLWDPAAGRLVGLRDRFGVCPFLYRATPQAVAVASDVEAVLGAFPACPPALDEIWIAEFLSGQPTSAQRTIHRGINRLEPAHMLLVEKGRTEIRRYWRLEVEPRHRPDPPEALLELLERSVAARMRGGTVGAMLSGGLDSSTLAVLASRMSEAPLPVVSMKFDACPEIDERAWIGKVHEAGRFRQLWLDGSEALGGTVEELLAEQGAPYLAPNLPTSRWLYRRAAEAGIEILLDGHGGDEVISFGTSRLTELAAEAQWRSLWRSTAAVSALFGSPRRELFLASASVGASSRWIRALARRLGPRATRDATAWRRAVHPDLVARTGLVQRVREANGVSVKGATDDIRRHIAQLTTPGYPTALEVLDRSAAPCGISPRYPFLERRVVEHCVAQPASAKFRDGMTRALLRDAMRGLLPDEIRLRSSKTDFSPNVRERVLRDWTESLDRLSRRDPGQIADFVDLGVIRGGIDGLRAGEADAPALFQTLRAIVLDEWLRAREFPAAARLDRRTPA